MSLWSWLFFLFSDIAGGGRTPYCTCPTSWYQPYFAFFFEKVKVCKTNSLSGFWCVLHCAALVLVQRVSAKSTTKASSPVMEPKKVRRQKTYFCWVCGEDCFTLGGLTKHKKIYPEPTGPKPYKCKECTKSFKKHDHLKTHFLIHSGEKNFECKECGKMFSLAQSLKTHMHLHSGKRNFSCPKCMMTFTQPEGLRSHVKTHEKMSLPCDKCSRTFSGLITLRTHKQLHTGTKTHICQICNKPFFRRHSLKTHMLSHSEERLFECNICLQSFKHPGTLSGHILGHTSGKRFFDCSICAKKFTQSSHVKTHIAKVHLKEEKSHSCLQCNIKFYLLSELNRHRKIHNSQDGGAGTEIAVVCDVCDKSLKSDKNLENQIWTQLPSIGPPWLDTWSPHTLTWYRASPGPPGALKGPHLARNVR